MLTCSWFMLLCFEEKYTTQISVNTNARSRPHECALTIIHHAGARRRRANNPSRLPPSLRYSSLNGSSHPFLIVTGWVRIHDLYFIYICIYIFFTWDSGAQEVEEFAVLGVHDGSLDELHHGVATVLELGVTPQAECPCRRSGGCHSSHRT